MKRFLFGDEKTAMKSSYIWNSLGGMLNACQSAILLIVISRTNVPEDAGVFAIAYAIASLALTLGNYSMRNFQVTDVTGKYSADTYFSSRIVTVFLMLVLMVTYICRGRLYLEYSLSKCMAIVWIVMLKVVDALEDVLHGLLQQNGRLDVAGKCLTIRYVIVLAVFSTGLIISRNLSVSAFVAFLASMLWFAITAAWILPSGFISVRLKDKQIYFLLRECVSLFLGGFLTIYIANAPKYAIDAHMTEMVQACFNYIFMPVYVISVLNAFIYQPVLNKMAVCYERKDYKAFYELFMKQIGIFLLLFIAVLLLGSTLGIPVLSWLYNTPLGDYKKPFIILLFGSAFLACSGYLAVVIILMRKQKWLLAGYLLSALLALTLSSQVVIRFGVLGASLLYTATVFVQMCVFIAVFVIAFYKIRREG